MACATKQIDEAVRGVLASSLEWDGDKAKLVCGTLDRKLYVKVNDVLESFGGKWSRKDKAHVFAANCQDELDAAIETGVYIRAADLKQIFGEFETPDDLADEAVRKLDLLAHETRVLEPSAGSGQLIRAVNRVSLSMIDAVEIQGKHHEMLSGITEAVHVADFLTLTPESIEGPFHRVLMNPPFAKQADIDHVLHAWKFLADGGRLVAIMSPGWTFRENNKSKDFRAFVAGNDGSWTKNPDGAFKVSGTNVGSIMLAMDK